MTNYRRDRLMGGSYFFTVNLVDRQSHLLTLHIDKLRIAHRHMIAKHPVHVDAMVVLPDHIHAIWTLADDDDNYSIRWQLFKSLFSSSPRRLGILPSKTFEHEPHLDYYCKNNNNFKYPMRQYIRDRTAGATYFLTFNLRNRKDAILVDQIDLIRAAYRKTQQHQPFQLNGIVVLPDHIHLLLTLPDQDDDYPSRVSLFKAAFTRQLPKSEYINESREAKRERGIWQRRFYEHRIRDDIDFQRHMDYIHYNPVKHGHVQNAKDWPYSTFHHCVNKGVYSLDWGDGLQILTMDFDD